MCYSLKFSRKGHVTLYLANQGLKFTIKSHFWWDFLFSPFHLKSIPLKSSAKNTEYFPGMQKHNDEYEESYQSLTSRTHSYFDNQYN